MPEKCGHVIDVLREEIVQGVHVGLLRPKENVVCQVLDDLGDEKQASPEILGWGSVEKTFGLGGDNGGAEESQENEGANRGVLGVWKLGQNSG